MEAVAAVVIVPKVTVPVDVVATLSSLELRSDEMRCRPQKGYSQFQVFIENLFSSAQLKCH